MRAVTGRWIECVCKQNHPSSKTVGRGEARFGRLFIFRELQFGARGADGSAAAGFLDECKHEAVQLTESAKWYRGLQIELITFPFGNKINRWFGARQPEMRGR
jgi:hypothetical protein